MTDVNPAAELAKLRWSKASDADRKAAAEAMAAGRKKIPKAKRSEIAKKAAAARWKKAEPVKRKKKRTSAKRTKKSRKKSS